MTNRERPISQEDMEGKPNSSHKKSIERRGEQSINTYEPMPGEDIRETAERIIALAKETKGNVKAKFNDIELTATEDSSVEDIVNGFNTKREEAAETYRKSPEGQYAARKSEERREEAQQKHDVLMEQLPNLDFTNQEAVLDWICEFQNPSDYGGVVKNQGKVLKIFAEHGYRPGMNTGKSFNGEDRDNFARYIVGQALDGLQGRVGAIHQLVHKFTDDWKRKFVS